MQLHGHQATEKAKQAPSRKDKDHQKKEIEQHLPGNNRGRTKQQKPQTLTK
jgi:hypothetical protein